MSNPGARDPSYAANAAAPPEAAAPESEPAGWVDAHGDYLYAYALLRLRDPGLAQDAVQDTFLAALQRRSAYAGRSAVRGWLLGILKHKIVDAFRRLRREPSLTDLGFFEGEEAERFVNEGLRRGAWTEALGPKDWAPKPGEALDRAEFWAAFRRCLSKLPRAVGQAFLLRELDDRDTREICALLHLSEANLWVMLHRARLALRHCLESNWFTR